MIANIIGAGIGAITPIIAELIRSKPDPEAAKQQIMSHREEMIARAIGEGQSQASAAKAVDADISAAIAQAEKEGSFNFPGGEVLAGALLGAAVPWVAGKIGGAVKGAAAAGKLGGKAKALAGKPVSNAASTVEGVAKVDTPVEQAAVAKAEKIDPTKFTMSEPSSVPFPSKGRGDFNVEVIGSTGGARMAPVEVSGPYPGDARGGEMLGMDRPAGMLGWSQQGRVPMPMINPRQGAVDIPGYLR